MIREYTGLTPTILAHLPLEAAIGPYRDVVVFTVPGDEYCLKFVHPKDADECAFDGTVTSSFWEAEQRLGLALVELDATSEPKFAGYRLLGSLWPAWNAKAPHEARGPYSTTPKREAYFSGRHQLREARTDDFDGDGDDELFVLLEIETLMDSYLEVVNDLDDAYVVAYTSTGALLVRPDLTLQLGLLVAQELVNPAVGFAEIEVHRLRPTIDPRPPGGGASASLELAWCEVDMAVDSQLSGCEREQACKSPTHEASLAYDAGSDAYLNAEVVELRPMVDDEWTTSECD